MHKILHILMLTTFLAACRPNDSTISAISTIKASQVPSNPAQTPSIVATPPHTLESKRNIETPVIRITQSETITDVAKITTTLQPTLSPFHQIFAWQPVSLEKSRYGYFNINEIASTDWNYLTPVETALPGADRSVSLAFSRYTQQIAYLVWNGVTELWIADTKLNNPERVWIDDDGWLGGITNFIDVRIVWGIDDRYVLLIPNFALSHLVIYDTGSKSVKEWEGNCNIVGKSPVSEDLVIWCTSSEDTQRKSYIVLERVGIIETDENPTIISKALDWVYSPDGDRLLFISDDLSIFVSLENKSLVKLSATYGTSDFFEIMVRQNLQWSHDGKRILVYAYGNPKDFCPKWQIDTNEAKLDDRPCWLVFDSDTGALQWKPSQNHTGLSIPWEYLSIVHGAALSEDGKWLVYIMMDIRVGRNFYFYIASLSDNRVKTLSADEAIYLSWGN